ncbi:MAG: hypothetical protein KGL11_01015 [Alphaproteobacteria bacterium]|nr:hypothetical protein [Alphaproteobacteria bacterium]
MDLSEIDLITDWLDFIEEWLATKQYAEAAHLVGIAHLSIADARRKIVEEAAA